MNLLILKNTKKIVAGIVLGLGVILLSTILHVFGLLGSIQLTLSNNLYEEREIGDEIIIVEIDDESILSEEEGGIGSIADWDSGVYAQVLHEIEADLPNSVMFDVFFLNGADGLTGNDIYNIASEYPQVNDFTNQVLSYLEEPHPSDLAFVEALAAYDNEYLMKKITGEAVLSDLAFLYEGALEPYSLFAENTNLAFVNVVTSDATGNESVIYGIPQKLMVDGEIEEHMDLQLARNYLGELGEIPSENGELLINYSGKAGSFPSVSFSDVYYGNYPAGIFDGKIILIGATTKVLQDVEYTPIDDSRPMPGIEIHANAIQTILDEAYLVKQSTAGFVATVGVLVLASAAAFMFLPVLASSGVAALEILAFPFYAQMRFRQGVILDLIWTVFAVVMVYLAVLVYRYMTEFKERRKLKSAFGHYVSPELVEQISSNPDMLKLGGERRVITTLFLDIENFTSLSESLKPDQVVKIINTYFDAFASLIMAHNGTVDKFEGDAIMALFGAPVTLEDHALKACQTAMAIRAKVGELNKQTGQNLNIRIGIASGASIVGNMGSQSRFDYTAMGDTVNTASRLESGNKFYGTRILVNHEAQKAAQDHIFFRRIDRVRLKGKENAIDIFEVMGPLDSVSEEGKAIVGVWHEALEYYRNGHWDQVEMRLRKVLAKMPEDGPAKTYLARLQFLKQNPPEGWDGVWNFDKK